jgi:hypothetical protein
MISRYQNVPQQLRPLSTLCMRSGSNQRIGCEIGTCVEYFWTDGIRRCNTFSRPSATALAQMRTQRGMPTSYSRDTRIEGILSYRHLAWCTVVWFEGRKLPRLFRPSATTPQLTCTKHKTVKRRAIRHDQHTRSPHSDCLVHDERNYVPRTRDVLSCLASAIGRVMFS